MGKIQRLHTSKILFLISGPIEMAKLTFIVATGRFSDNQMQQLRAICA